MAALIDKGDVTFEYKHFIVVGDGVRSTWAAEASECAADQGKFWAYHDVLLKSQQDQPWSKDKLKGYGAKIGLDSKAFGQCIDKRTHADAVKADQADGTKLQVKGTPTYFVNGKQVPLDFNLILKTINDEVSKK